MRARFATLLALALAAGCVAPAGPVPADPYESDAREAILRGVDKLAKALDPEQILAKGHP